MKLLNILLNENIQIASKEGMTKNGKPYKVVLLTSDSTDENKRKKENATIGAMLKITNADKAKNYSDFKKIFGSMEPPAYQMTTDKSVFGWGYFVNNDADEKTKIDNLKKLKTYVDSNGGFEAGNTDIKGFSDLPKINEFIEKLKAVAQEISSGKVDGNDAVKDDLVKKIEEFINDLATEVDDIVLVEKLDEYFAWASQFPNYSFSNQILIWIQKRDAKRVASTSVWKNLGYAPKEGALQIWLWRPTLVPPTWAQKNERKAEFIKKNGMPAKGSAQEKEMDKKINEPISKMPFILYPTYDMTDVVDSEGNMGGEKEKPKLDWSSEIESESADKISDAMEKVITSHGIKLDFIDSEHGEKGSSASGSIKIDKTSKGIGKASVLIHEFAHEIMHQRFLNEKAKAEKSKGNVDTKTQSILDAYVGRDVAKTLELQAEGVAYVVLRAMGLPNELLGHSKNYIALWRGNSSSIHGNLEIITKAANIVINEINQNMTQVSEADGGELKGSFVTQNDVAKLLDAPKIDGENSIDEVMKEINEAKKIFKTILN